MELTSGFKHNIHSIKAVAATGWKSESMRNQRGSQLNWQTPLSPSPPHTHTCTPLPACRENWRILSWRATPFQISIHAAPLSTWVWAEAECKAGKGWKRKMEEGMKGKRKEWQSKRWTKVRHNAIQFGSFVWFICIARVGERRRRRFPFGFECDNTYILPPPLPRSLSGCER